MVSNLVGAGTASGAIFCATGSKYLDLALEAIESFCHHHPEVPVTLFCDFLNDSHTERIASLPNVRLHFLENPEFGFGDKIWSMRKSPYEKTVYLDADTLVIRPIWEDLSSLLEHFSLVALPNMSLNHRWEEEAASRAFGQFNTGVVLYNKSKATEFLDAWHEAWLKEEPDSRGHDQPSFRLAQIQSNTFCAPLSAEFNFMGTGGVGEVRVLHFTAWRRQQVFYWSRPARNRLINRFQQEGYGGLFSDFSVVGSHHTLRAGDTSGRFSWWIVGAWLWLWVRARRYLRGLFRRIVRSVRWGQGLR